MFRIVDKRLYRYYNKINISLKSVLKREVVFMRKALTKILCTVLAAIMVFSCTSVAFAGNEVTPVVLVHGMGAAKVYKNPESKDKKELGSFDVGSLFTSNNDLVHMLLDATQGKISDKNTLVNRLAKAFADYSDIACDKDGNPASDTGIAGYWTDSLANHKDYLESETSSEPALWKAITEQVGAQNVYAFNYDWRVDAAVTGEKLDEFIEIVKQQTGKSKVTLVGGSEGTVVISAYVDAHKNDNELEKVVYVNGAFNGVGVCRVYAQDLYFDKDVVLNYLAGVTQTIRNSSFDLNRLTWLATTAAGTADNLCKLLNEVINDPQLMKSVYMDVLYPVFGTIPALWEFIPYDAFDTAVEKMSAIGFLDKSSGLYTKITNYHAIQGRLVSNITELKNKGVQVAIIANYGIPAIPCTSDYAAQSDALIETKYASLGATVADFGKTLPSSRTEKNNYASLDEVIDASTCAFPDNTWFIKGVQHMGFWYGSQACTFVATIVATDAPLTVSSIKSLTGNGQFIATDTSLNITEMDTNKPKSSKVKKLKSGKKSAKVTLGRVSSVKGYQIQYSTSSKFTKKKTKTVTISGAKKTSKTLKKLKSNKKYYVRVRTYKIVANQKVYSDWSAVKTVKVK